ncbi:MAG: transposase [Pseudomonadota bacterium]|nr:transposase [Pseudomonadota bacterium]MDE3038472.1 transposase [Pseudomonadota bacterium]
MQSLRQAMQKCGSQNIVYFDESGFRSESYRPHGWVPVGQKVFGLISGNNRKATNLIMAQRGKEWLEKMLLPEITRPSVIVMDNARFHNKEQIQDMLEKAGHAMLPLPRYSPDFNPIEQSFATIKKQRQFHSSDDIQQIIVGNYRVK